MWMTTPKQYFFIKWAQASRQYNEYFKLTDFLLMLLMILIDLLNVFVKKSDMYAKNLTEQFWYFFNGNTVQILLLW